MLSGLIATGERRRPARGWRPIFIALTLAILVAGLVYLVRGYGGEGLEAHLQQLRAGSDEPIVFVLHYTCPRVEFTDRGKTALIIPRIG